MFNHVQTLLLWTPFLGTSVIAKLLKMQMLSDDEEVVVSLEGDQGYGICVTITRKHKFILKF